MNTSDQYRHNEEFKRILKRFKSKMARGNCLGKNTRFIHKQANKHRKPMGCFCVGSAYLWSATRGNCFFRRRGLSEKTTD